jgi:hypothetical protein
MVDRWCLIQINTLVAVDPENPLIPCILQGQNPGQVARGIDDEKGLRICAERGGAKGE